MHVHVGFVAMRRERLFVAPDVDSERVPTAALDPAEPNVLSKR
jgi:hypothetical protein